MKTTLTTIFLANQGLSSSEASHTKNVAKEMATRLESELESVTIVEEKIVVDGTEHNYNVVNRLTNPEIVEKLTKEGELYSLCAWLSEGIKSKEKLIKSLEQHDFADEIPFVDPNPLIKEKQEEIKLLIAPISPLIKGQISELKPEDVLDTKELNDYFTCEAKAAHIGKKIHTNGLVNRWKFSLYELKPIRFEGEKQNLVKSTAIFGKTFIDDLFFDLQKKHREYESKLNYYKAKIHNHLSELNDKIQRENIEKNEQYQLKLKEYQTTFNTLQKEINDLIMLDNEKKTNRNLEVMKIRNKLKTEFSQLKIIVPFDLENILNEVQKFSKN